MYTRNAYKVLKSTGIKSHGNVIRKWKYYLKMDIDISPIGCRILKFSLTEGRLKYGNFAQKKILERKRRP
jgi:hypothetical protein